MAALDGEHQIADCGGVATDHMHLRAEFLADHALGVANAVCGVEREAGRNGMQHRAALTGGLRGGGFEYAMHIAL